MLQIRNTELKYISLEQLTSQYNPKKITHRSETNINEQLEKTLVFKRGYEKETASH